MNENLAWCEMRAFLRPKPGAGPENGRQSALYVGTEIEELGPPAALPCTPTSLFEPPSGTDLPP